MLPRLKRFFVGLKDNFVAAEGLPTEKELWEKERQRVREWLLDLGKDTEYTPDVATLQRRWDWLLFVPDELMSGFPGHTKLGESAFKMADAITEDKFSFWRKDLALIQEAIPLQDKMERAPHCPIRGEVYLVKSHQFFSLDTHRRNGVEFLRQRVKLKVPYRQATKVFVMERNLYELAVQKTLYHEGTINAWMYVGNPEYWDPLISSGTKITHRLPDGTKEIHYVSRAGLFVPVSSFKPHNPQLETYYYFVRKISEDYRKSRPMFFVR